MLCMASAATLTAQNAVTSTDANGYLERGLRMFDNKNYVGCIDQLSMLRNIEVSESLLEEADYYITLAKFNRNDKTGLDDARQFLRRYPSSPRRLYVEFAIADHLSRTARHEEARKAFADIPENAFDSRKTAELIFKRSVTDIQCGDYDKALAGLSRLKNDKVYREPANYYIAVIDYSNGRYDEAEKKFRGIPKKSPLWKEAQFYICQIDFHNREFATVQSDGESLLGAALPDEMKTELLRIVGESNYHLGNFDQSVNYLRQYVDRTDRKPERSALYILGINEFRNENYGETVRFLGEVTTADDEMAQSAYLYAGQSYLRLGNVNAASLAFEKAYTMPYDESVCETAFYNYAIAQSQGGRTPFANSMRIFRDFLNRFPNSRYAPEVEDYVVNAYLSGKDYETALGEIATISKPSAKILLAKQALLHRIGARELTKGNTDTAIDYLQQADKLAAYDRQLAAENALWMAEAFLRKNDNAAAEKAYQRYLSSTKSTSPNVAKANYGLGYALYGQRKYKQAQKAFSAAAGQLSGQLQADAYNRIADCLYYNLDFTTAEAFYDKALALNAGRNDYALFQKAMMRGLRHNEQDKIDMMDRLVATYPSSTFAPKAVYEKAQAYEALGKSDRAFDTFRTLAKTYPQSPEARQGLLQMALLLKNRGQNEEARKQYEGLIAKYPSSEEAKVAIDDLKRIYAAEGRIDSFAAFMRSVGSSYEIDANEMAALSFEAAENDYLSHGRTEKLKTFIRQYPKSAHTGQAAYYVAEYASQNGRHDEAAEYVDKALLIAPDASYAEAALSLKGNLMLERDDYKEAEKAFRQLESRATSAFYKQIAQTGIARAADKSGDMQTAKKYADILLQSDALTDDTQAEMRYIRATAEIKERNAEAAVADYTALVENNVETLYGSMAAIELGNYYFALKDYKKAEKTVNRLLDSATTHQYWMARGFILLSDIHHAQGDNFQAREYLESLKSNYPGTEGDIFEMIDKRLKDLK